MLRTVRRPDCKEVMIGILQGATAAYGNKPGSRLLLKMICPSSRFVP